SVPTFRPRLVRSPARAPPWSVRAMTSACPGPGAATSASATATYGPSVDASKMCQGSQGMGGQCHRRLARAPSGRGGDRLAWGDRAHSRSDADVRIGGSREEREAGGLVSAQLLTKQVGLPAAPPHRCKLPRSRQRQDVSVTKMANSCFVYSCAGTSSAGEDPADRRLIDAIATGQSFPRAGLYRRWSPSSGKEPSCLLPSPSSSPAPPAGRAPRWPAASPVLPISSSLALSRGAMPASPWASPSANRG